MLLGTKAFRLNIAMNKLDYKKQTQPIYILVRIYVRSNTSTEV